MPATKIRNHLTHLADSRVRFVSAPEICDELQLKEEECERILQDFVDQGLLRMARSKTGVSYYWLTPKCSGGGN